MESRTEVLLIAPCGMNCGTCVAYLRHRNRCPGCRGPDDKKSVTRLDCRIKNCAVFHKENADFCFECGNFPCDRLKHLDKRYRTKYHMSMIENLENIRKSGIVEFMENEKIRWTCARCGGTICVHRGYCYDCGEKIS
ncbi:MAG: hypothetical protein AWU59_1128 [Methanolobus sp. T82-4]|nr:MAG: hypothetical protein AWU59_1128 [Methanolobus sp. T82-4]